MRFAIAFVSLVASVSLTSTACKGKKGSTTTAGSGSGSDTVVLAQKVAIHWGIRQGASSAEIFLQTTTETGRQVSHPVGNFKGTCAASTPGAEMKAIIGARCEEGAQATELHCVVRGSEIIVLKLTVMDGLTPDPMERVEVTRIAVAPGAAIVAD